MPRSTYPSRLAQKRRLQQRRGLVVFDAVLGLVMITFLLTVFALLVGHQRAAAAHFASQRQAIGVIEETAARLRTSEPDLPEGVRVEPVAPGWSRVTAGEGAGRVELLVPVETEAGHRDEKNGSAGGAP